MRPGKLLISIYVILSAGCFSARHIKADPPLNSNAVDSLIHLPSFTFIPQYVTPMTGRRRDLERGYELRVSKDTLTSYLPYFGRGYIAPVSPSDVDFDYTSTQFSYNISTSKSGWIISIKVKDQTYLRDLYLRVYDNAAASLNVTSIDRSSITYDGYIVRRKSAGEKK